jgi:hypothetical protein
MENRQRALAASVNATYSLSVLEPTIEREMRLCRLELIEVVGRFVTHHALVNNKNICIRLLLQDAVQYIRTYGKSEHHTLKHIRKDLLWQ